LMSFPPCIKRMLMSWSDAYAIFVASYLKTHVASESTLAFSKANLWNRTEVTTSVARIWRSAPRFSCPWVKQSFPDFCDEELCPLKHAHDPISFIISHISEPPIYMVQSGKAGTYVLHFGNRTIEIPVVNAYRRPRDYLVAISDAISDAYGLDIDLTNIALDDEENKIKPIDIIKQLFSELRRMGVKRYVEYDPLGLMDVLSDVLSSNGVGTVMVYDINSVTDPDAMSVYIDYEKKRICFPPDVLRMLLSRAGVRMALPVLTKTLRNIYNVPKLRLSIKGKRMYYYVIDESILHMLFGKGFDELLEEFGGSQQDIMRIVEQIEEGDK